MNRRILKAFFNGFISLMMMLGSSSWVAAAVSPLERMEGLVQPGDLIQGHAHFETKCSKCHEAFDKSKQSQLCRDCHEQIDKDIKTEKKFHGRLYNIAKRECFTCHTDHKGRDEDVVQLNPETFDHRRTAFILEGAHQSTDCKLCHKKEKFYRIPKFDCIDCHEKDDSHKGRMGKKCANCHLELGWYPANFNHDKTDFPLRNTHQEIGCQYCHVNERYIKTPKNCYFCHYLDDVHDGDRGVKCHQCHHDEKWSRIEFDHEKDTNFALHGAHESLLCKDCHTKNIFKDEVKAICYNCHKVHDSHYGNYGKRCGSCHNAKKWRDVKFDHDQDTEFKLKGEHKELECAACHKGDLFSKKTPKECGECHRLDDAHEGQQGDNCIDCHNESSWVKKVVFDHDITKFPLHGSHQFLSCEDCHASEKFKDSEVHCVSCHKADDDEVHKLRLGKSCELCHGPFDWLIWQFDHDNQTDYPLDGKHKGLDCHACHTTAVKDEIDLPTNCFGCHEKDDSHAGQLGRQCEKCHVTESFKKIKIRE